MDLLLKVPSIRIANDDPGVSEGSPIVWVDDSPSNAICRVLTGGPSVRGKPIQTDEELHSGQNIEITLEDIPDLAPCDCSLALERMELAVVGLLENWEATINVLDTWFPWITRNITVEEEDDHVKRLVFSPFNPSLRKELLSMHEYKTLDPSSYKKKSSSTLLKERMLPSSLQKIEAHNACDMQLYEKGRALFQRQVRFMMGHGLMPLKEVLDPI